MPNIIIILTDDQGYGDLSCYGAEGFETPNIDSMATQGMLFTNFYVSQAVCSASRASLMTGSYAERVGIQGALSPWSVNGLDSNIETIPKLLKRHGYVNAIFGKWHLGHRLKYLPLQNGFDEYSGLICSNDMWPVDYDGNPLDGDKLSYYPPMSFWKGNEKKDTIKTLEEQGLITGRITELACDFINRNKDNHFFLYVPHPMPHQPIAASDKFKGRSDLGLYGDVIMEIDWSVGQIMKTLKNNSIDENTLVIFASDNGPWLNYGKWGGSAGPLREGKGTMWEGGARVPCIMRWPQKIAPGKIVDNIAATMDIFPTIAEITGDDKIGYSNDGVSLMPILREDDNANPRVDLFYYYGEKLIAVRKGKWKLVFPHEYRSYAGVEPGENLHPGPYNTGKSGLELYDLDNDMGEKNNLAKFFPYVVKELEELADVARSKLGDKLTGKIGSESYDAICGYESAVVELNNKASDSDLVLKNLANEKYPGESDFALINGKGGTIDYKNPSWQGFEAQDLIATIDLGEIMDINSVEVRFLQSQVFWIFLPKNIEIEHSVDGINYELIYENIPKNDFSFDQKIFSYKANIIDLKSRYVRVKGFNLNECPDYHPGAGLPCWIFSDEIIIN
ncbi:MAG: sulfatase-like hydrolase/transferase [Candidatus Neomarinimicrobiota bacterium]